MLVTWSPHQASNAAEVIEYLMAERVKKKTGGGRQSLLVRNPQPELLYGSPALVGAFIDAIPFQNRYRCATMSFDARDVDVSAFNAGADTVRAQVGAATRLFLELAFAGIPPHLRPPVLIGTHSHTKRLEINILMPRAIGPPDGRVRSWNPHPPRPRSREDWDAFVDVANETFGWSDPRSPDRFVDVAPPNWMLKQMAEHGRQLDADMSSIPDQRFRCWAVIDRAVEMTPWPRSTLIANIDEALHEFDWKVVSQSDGRLTVGAVDGSSRVSFRGAAFGGVDLGQDPFDAMLQRQTEIARAPARLCEALDQRARDNLRLTRGDSIQPDDPADILRDLHPLYPIKVKASKSTDRLGRRIQALLMVSILIGTAVVEMNEAISKLVQQIEGTTDDGERKASAAIDKHSGERFGTDRGCGRHGDGQFPDQSPDDRNQPIELSGSHAGSERRSSNASDDHRSELGASKSNLENRREAESHGSADPLSSRAARWCRGHWLSCVGQLARRHVGPCKVGWVHRDDGDAILVKLTNQKIEIPVFGKRPDAEWSATALDRLGVKVPGESMPDVSEANGPDF